ncbi:hypothetical protein GCM10025864_41470 [Luteimicrobium album]|uniref:Uncharacterized protein n=1 Tax=Luteimicrobium album TaxID=1054550 RepID=A0ABQ6I8A3_9MICO|nr:hypothetical protein GCM10025864_41470 [Luteimicrobium album]
MTAHDPEAGIAEQADEHQDETGTEEPELLADDREDEVVRRRREVTPRLAARPESDARETAGSQRLQTVDRLVAEVLRVRRVRVAALQQDGDPPAAVGVAVQEQLPHEDATDPDPRHQHPHRDPGDEEGADDEHHHDERGAEVLAGEHEGDDEQRPGHGRDDRVPCLAEEPLLASEDRREPHHQRELRDLGRLEAQRAQVHPGVVAADLVRQTWHEHEALERERAEQTDPREPLVDPHGHARRDQQERDTDERVLRLLEEDPER